MLIEIDEAGSAPLYQQIHDQVVEGIARGEVTKGEALLPVRQMAAAFGINPATVVKAYDALKRDGLVVANRRSGSVIVADPATATPSPEFVDGWRTRARTLAADAVVQGVPAEEIVDLVRAELAELGHPAKAGR